MSGVGRSVVFWVRFWITLLVVLLGLAPSAQAQLETVLAPGKVVAAHAKWEGECAKCHVRGKRDQQDGRCIECHKEVGQDILGKTGLHGRMKPQFCRSCHTDHKGRDARIVTLEKKGFDHNRTDYRLLAKHQNVACEKCHLPGKKWSQAPLDCVSCHRKDDVHKEGLGVKCVNCHSEKSWKDTDFDHGETKFPLTGKHSDVKCADCHRDKRYKETPKSCYGCHRKDDDRNERAHKGRFGEKCESCHGTRSWKTVQFNHDVDTKYVLRGKHKTTSCTTCHTGQLYKLPKLQQDCWSCHRKDDKHKEVLGRDCVSCHTENDWKQATQFSHDRTSFPLVGQHAQAECKDCHVIPSSKSVLPNYKDVPKDCYGCHKREDKHEGTLGTKCENCHTERVWKNWLGRFDHNSRTVRFPLLNAHANPKIKCAACHPNAKSFRNIPMDCYSCHKKDDKHEGTLSLKCETCHSDVSWKGTNFDHARTRFPLTGRHVAPACKDCHQTKRYRDTSRECYACHKDKDDKQHKLRFGTSCEACHNVRLWGVWDFDHESRAKYRLEGGHRKANCESCHRRPAPAGKKAAPVGTACIGCHRNDDRHDGQFGTRCEQCHQVDNWARVIQPGTRKGLNRSDQNDTSLSLPPSSSEMMSVLQMAVVGARVDRRPQVQGEIR